MEVEQQGAADEERADVDVERGRGAGGGDHDAADSRPEHECRGEADVQGGVGAALGLLRRLLDVLERPVRARLGLLARRARELRAKQCARGQRRDAVERREQQDRRQPEVQEQMARAAVATASNRYRALSSLRRRDASTLTTTAGTTNAGTA